MDLLVYLILSFIAGIAIALIAVVCINAEQRYQQTIKESKPTYKNFSKKL